jgi:hypothetical protein
MPKIQKVRPRNRVQIERAANDLIRRFQPDALKQVMPVNVELFFELELEDDIGIEPICEALPAGIDGYTDSLNKVCKISNLLYEYGESDIKRRRLRATIAHELGHCYLHVSDAAANRNYERVFTNDGQHPLELYDPNDLRACENPEWQAWAFASALLMPAPCFNAVVNNNWTKKKIKYGFDVNPSFIDVRLRELKISKMLRNG